MASFQARITAAKKTSHHVAREQVHFQQFLTTQISYSTDVASTIIPILKELAATRLSAVVPKTTGPQAHQASTRECLLLERFAQMILQCFKPLFSGVDTISETNVQYLGTLLQSIEIITQVAAQCCDTLSKQDLCKLKDVVTQLVTKDDIRYFGVFLNRHVEVTQRLKLGTYDVVLSFCILLRCICWVYDEMIQTIGSRVLSCPAVCSILARNGGKSQVLLQLFLCSAVSGSIKGTEVNSLLIKFLEKNLAVLAESIDRRLDELLPLGTATFTEQEEILCTHVALGNIFSVATCNANVEEALNAVLSRGICCKLGDLCNRFMSDTQMVHHGFDVYALLQEEYDIQQDNDPKKQLLEDCMNRLELRLKKFKIDVSVMRSLENPGEEENCKTVMTYIQKKLEQFSKTCACCMKDSIQHYTETQHKLRACSRCHTAYYCSRECQLKHWTEGGHKLTCKSVEASTQQQEQKLVEDVNQQQETIGWLVEVQRQAGATLQGESFLSPASLVECKERI